MGLVGEYLDGSCSGFLGVGVRNLEGNVHSIGVEFEGENDAGKSLDYLDEGAQDLPGDNEESYLAV